MRFSGIGHIKGLSSHETTPKWHGFLMIKLAASVANNRAAT
jgi:hypothetical protein